jgi:hypothetical protein
MKNNVEVSKERTQALTLAKGDAVRHVDVTNLRMVVLHLKELKSNINISIAQLRIDIEKEDIKNGY